jgi:hypothetical protein
LEFREIEGVEDWRYRTRLKGALPVGRGAWWESSPFISDELFYGFRAGGINRNRLIVGIEKPLSPQLSLETSYITALAWQPP